MMAALDKPAMTASKLVGSPARAVLSTRLAALDGYDLATGLHSVAGHLPLLARVLARFVTTFRAGQPSLLDASAHEHENVVRWRAVCHSLRGACATIGAVALLAEVDAVERQLHALASPGVLAASAARLNDALIDFTGRLARELAA